jgi:hypothetical protein
MMLIVCGPCGKRTKTVSCTWATDSSRASLIPTDYIKRLEDRIKLLEERNRESHHNQPTNNPSSNDTLEDSAAQTTSNDGATTLTSPVSPTRLLSVPWRNYSPMNTLGTSTDPWPSNPAAFGGLGLSPSFQELREISDTTFSSNNIPDHDVAMDDNNMNDSSVRTIVGNFMQEVENVVAEKLGEASLPASNTLSRSQDSSSPQQEDSDYILPTREQADTLLNSYWSYVHVLYPFLDKSQVEEDYDKIWYRNNSITNQRSFFCLLNSIFAIGSRQFRSATSNHDHSADIFCMRARELLDFEACSIRSVQSYLLLALYFQSTDEMRKCWVFLGLATRTAQMLEPHLPGTSEQITGSRNKEALCKIWHGCILIDREVSMLHGRLSMIDPKITAAVPLPVFMEEENLQVGDIGEHTIQAPQTHIADFFNSSLKFYNIVYDVLHNMHSSQLRRDSENERNYSEDDSSLGTTTSIIKLQERLSKWEKDNHDNLKIENYSPYNDMSSVLVRQAVVLHQR